MTRPRRRHGRLLPTNGSVTRTDILRIYAEFAKETREALAAGEMSEAEPPTIDEFVRYLVGAIVDRPVGPGTRRRMAAAQRRRWSQNRQHPAEPAPETTARRTAAAAA
jgi:hypothetical protein